MNITIWGAGSWGTALALILDNKKHNICLWDRKSHKIKMIQETGLNQNFLNNTPIPPSIKLTADQEEACRFSSFHIFAIPSHALRNLLKTIRPLIGKNNSFVSVIKGIEEESLTRMTQVIANVFSSNNNIGCLSGPTHAEEVVKKTPCAAVVGSDDSNFSKLIQEIFSTNEFRIYINNDLPGIELGGALKNVIAIATGISDGLGLGANSKSALMTRGLSEMQKIAMQEGGKLTTLMGLSGMGDLITTCISSHSRNRYLGECLGKGLSLQETLSSMNMIAEGINTSKSAYCLSQKHDLDTPIIDNVYQVLFEEKLPQTALKELFNRPQKKEYFSQ